MGMSVQQNTSNGKRRRFQPISEINVTPFVDVMLVLLIIFMISAPLLTAGVEVNLPQSQAGPLQQEEKPLVISVRAENQLFLQETPYGITDLVSRLQAIVGERPEVPLYLRADEGLPYGYVMEVMGQLNQAGLKNIALVTDPVQ